MDKRTLLLIVALVLPVLALALLARSPAEEPRPATPMRAEPPALPEGRTHVPGRLPSAQGKARPIRENTTPPPLSLEQARRQVKAELDRLERMTESQWNTEQRFHMERKRWWDSLPQEEKLRLIEQGPPPPPGAMMPPPENEDIPPEMPAPQKDEEEAPR